jgi:hypothetical protein
VLHAGSKAPTHSVLNRPLAHDLVDRRLDETRSDHFPVAIERLIEDEVEADCGLQRGTSCVQRN